MSNNSPHVFFGLIDWRVCLAAFCLGLFALMFKKSYRRKLYIYPTKENVDQIMYLDGAGQCFEAVQTPVPCPVNTRFDAFTRLLPQTTFQ